MLAARGRALQRPRMVGMVYGAYMHGILGECPGVYGVYDDHKLLAVTSMLRPGFNQ